MPYYYYILLILVLWGYLRYFGPVFVTFKKLVPVAQTPTRAYHRSACYDIYSLVDRSIPIGSWQEISTGVAFAPAFHFHIPLLNLTITPFGNIAGRIFTRSSQAKKGLRCHLGIIDNDFRGEWTVIVYNHNPEHPVRIHIGDKIAQIEFYRVPSTWLFSVKRLSTSLRGERKFGSSGR